MSADAATGVTDGMDSPSSMASRSSIESLFFDSGLVAAAVIVDGQVEYASPGLTSLIGERALKARCFSSIVSDPDRPRTEEAIQRCAALRAPQSLQCSLVHREGRLVPIEFKAAPAEIGGCSVTLVVVHDRTEHAAIEQRLCALAHYDALTNLPNRLLLQDRLRQGFAAASRNGFLLGLLVIDLDGFKAVNDGMGHAAGDGVLRETACRFSKCVRSADTLARVGGDEFVVVLPELVRREDAAVIAARLINALRAPFAVEDAQASIGASIGIALYPDDAADIDALFASADAAMYSAKRAGKSRYAFADGSATAVLAAESCEWSNEWHLGIDVMDSDHEALFALLNELRSAIASECDKGLLGMRLRQLVDFCARHFAEEERLMSAMHLASLDSHRAEHQRLLVDLAELSAHTHWVGAAMTMRFLKSWLIGHMQTYDRAAAREIREVQGERHTDAA